MADELAAKLQRRVQINAGEETAQVKTRFNPGNTGQTKQGVSRS